MFPCRMDLLSRLNESQLRAVTFGDGPVMIVAGAGTGKTTTLTCRIAHLITHAGVPAENILAITFTVRAAEQMRERLRTFGLSPAVIEKLWIGTIHSFCHEILRHYGDLIGIPKDFRLIPEPDRVALLKGILKEENLSPDTPRTPKQLDRMITLEKGSGCSETELSAACRLYQEKLKLHGLLDFDDLILHTLHLFRNNPHTAAELRRRFTHVFVDEYQDINTAQYLVLRHLLGERPNLCVVGDADQAIYAFRGAQVKNFLSFQNDFPQATALRLQENYRSTSTIIRAACSVIQNNRERMAMELVPTRPEGTLLELIEVSSDVEEARIICNRIESLIGGTRFETIPIGAEDGLVMGLGDIAVLYRLHRQNRLIKKELERRGIPVQVAKTRSFYDEPEVALVLAALEAICHPERDQALMVLLEESPYALGDEDIKILCMGAGQKGVSLFSSAGCADILSKLSSAGAERFRNLTETISAFRDRLTQMPIETVTRTLWETLACQSDELPELLTCIMPFAHLPTPQAIDRFVEKAAMLREGDYAAPPHEAVTLMTVHMAKGLEFSVVFLTGLEEGLFPYSEGDGREANIEEERRLFYVGMTRAREKLFLTTSRSRFLFGSRKEMRPSSFLQEIPECFIKKTIIKGSPRKEKTRQLKLFV